MILASITQSFGQRRMKAEPFESIEVAKSWVEAEAEAEQFSGIVLVIQNGKEVWRQAYGYADQNTKSENKIDTKFNLGSINKTFTAVATVQLIEQGKLGLEDKAIDYIPELKKIEFANEITIRHLLTMTSGFGFYWESDLFKEQKSNLREMEDYLPIILESNLSFKPGASRQYSNTGYEILGLIIQRVSGINYYEYVRDNVYKVAGMNNTDAYEKDKPVKNLARSYSKYEEDELINFRDPKKGPYANDATDWIAVKGTAAGGGYSTVEDMLAYMKALNSNKLISKKYTDMLINRFEKLDTRSVNYMAGGGAPGINAFVMANFKNDSYIIVLSNFDPPTASTLALRLDKTLNTDESVNE